MSEQLEGVSRPSYWNWVQALVGVVLFSFVAHAFYDSGWIKGETFGGSKLANALAMLFMLSLAALSALLLVFMAPLKYRWNSEYIESSWFGLRKRMCWNDVTEYLDEDEAITLTDRDKTEFTIHTEFLSNPQELRRAIAGSLRQLRDTSIEKGLSSPSMSFRKRVMAFVVSRIEVSTDRISLTHLGMKGESASFADVESVVVTKPLRKGTNPTFRLFLRNQKVFPLPNAEQFHVLDQMLRSRIPHAEWIDYSRDPEAGEKASHAWRVRAARSAFTKSRSLLLQVFICEGAVLLLLVLGFVHKASDPAFPQRLQKAGPSFLIMAAAMILCLGLAMSKYRNASRRLSSLDSSWHTDT